jgi:hypothetical protein
VLKALARLPVDSSSTSTALADRSLAYPAPLAEPYAYSNGGYSSLAASLPHDPRPLTYALVRQLEKQPSVPLPASSIFRPDEARSEKALVASLGEWATLADDIGSGAPASIEERRWEEHQRTVVSNLTLKTLVSGMSSLGNLTIPGSWLLTAQSSLSTQVFPSRSASADRHARIPALGALPLASHRASLTPLPPSACGWSKLTSPP